MVVDTQYRIIDSNPAMSPILGRSSGEDLIGYDLQQSLPVLHSHILETMGQKSRMEFEIGAIPFDILISPLYEKDQQNENSQKQGLSEDPYKTRRLIYYYVLSVLLSSL